MTPLKAIRQKCVECCCGNMAEVAKCVITDCALYEFRMGHNPNLKLSDEELERRRQIGRENAVNFRKRTK